jgi:DNA polymerase V
VDQINSTMGQRTLIFGAQGLSQAWSPNANKRSPRYTTDWKDIPKVN